MCTVQITDDDILVTELDSIAKAEKINRSAFKSSKVHYATMIALLPITSHKATNNKGN